MKRKFLLVALVLTFSGAQSQIGFGPVNTLSTTVDGARGVYIADLDHDGDNDVLAAGFFDDDVFWFENTDGLGSFGGKTQISPSNSLDGCWSVKAGDMNGDGWIDVVAGAYSGDKLSYFPGDGTGLFGAEVMVSDSLNSIKDFDLADFDGDGDLDVVTANSLDDEFYLILNNDDDTFTSPVALPSGIYWFNGARSVRCIDFDKDGDMDVVSASSISHVMGWHENDGNANFADFQYLTQEIFEPQCVDVADFDGDGDYDLTSAVLFGDKIAAHFNPGELTAWTDVDLNDDFTYAIWVRVGDLDQDADADIVGAAKFGGSFVYFANDGEGNFSGENLITDLPDGPEAHAVGDLNGDGFPDVAMASFFDNRISWVANQHPLPCLSADFNYDESVNVGDLLLLLGIFGCNEMCGRYDLDGDESVNSADVAIFLQQYGQDC